MLVAIIAAFAAFFVFEASKKEAVISGIMLNSMNAVSENSFERFSERFLDALNVDQTKFEISLTTNLTYSSDNEENAESNYAAVQVLLAQTSGNLLDFVIGDLASVQTLAYSSFFIDLSTVLSEEQMDRYEPYLCYIDLAVIEAIEAAVASENYDADISIPDCTKPETMKKPVPVFIDTRECQHLSEIYPYGSDRIVIAVAVNAPHEEMLSKLVDFLMAS